MDAREENLVKFTLEVYKHFDDIRTKTKDEISFRFWDVVVLTACDEEQKKAFELQIAGKIERREIPEGVEYHVYADPPGVKIGCGGATMHVISQLTDTYGSRLDSLYVLLINAGGQSQRLASATVLGKIFTALPMGSPPWQVLELKLAAYIPLLARMNPGFLHVASDTIEVYDVGDGKNSGDWNFTRPGLTAFAHPSPIDIGRTHGVFVLDEKSAPSADDDNDNSIVKFVPCVEVLQKPSVDVMRRKNAIVRLNSDDEIVYTDSLYYFDHRFAKRLLDFYKLEAPLSCEIDGYGDFMQPLGKNATSDYVSDTRNFSVVTGSSISTRLRLFKCLQGTPLNVIALDSSRFYHLGTTREYLHNLCVDRQLSNCTGFKRSTFSRYDECVNDGVVVHSVLTDMTAIGKSSVVEYCRFDRPVTIGDSCIVSNCSCEGNGGRIIIPSNIFMHTVPVIIGSCTQFVTIVFNIDDDVKFKVDKDREEVASSSLKFLGKPLLERLESDFSVGDLFSCDIYGRVVCSLWYARLFAVEPSMEKSFAAGLDLARGGKVDLGVDAAGRRYFSAAEVASHKDAAAMLGYRRKLFEIIVAGH